MSATAFELPADLEAGSRPRPADSPATTCACWWHRADGRLVHSRFRDLAQFLAPGDLLVLNTSATLPAALPAARHDGTALELRLSTPAPGRDPARFWIVELRRGVEPFAALLVGEVLSLPAGGGSDDSRALCWRSALARRLGADAAARRLSRRARRIRSATATCPSVAAVRVPERVRDRAGKRRDAERRPPVYGRAGHPARRRRRARGARHPARRRLVARKPRASLPGAVSGSRARRRGSRTPSTSGAVGSSPSGPPWSGHSRPSPGRTEPSRSARGGRTSS